MTALVFVPLTGVSVIAPEPLADTPDNVPMTLDVQSNVVPPIDDVGKYANVVVLQISCINDDGESVITGIGPTVTTASTGIPEHPPAIGVIRYVTVPEFTPSVDVSTWLIKFPLPAAAPVTLVELSTTHTKFVPVTPLGFVMETLVLFPEQIV
jgi:hypothetical protein